ncbi:MAG: hypothetical protein ACP5VQ_05715 [Phycisphaerae bacterium]
MAMKKHTFRLPLLKATLAILVLSVGLLCGAASAVRRHSRAGTPAKVNTVLPLMATLRTGSVLENVPGKLVLKPGVRYPKFQFIHPKKDWPRTIQLLPCLALQAMELIQQPHTGFVLSGIVTQYQHQLYLLPSADVRLLQNSPMKKTRPATSATTQPLTASLAQKTTAQAVLNNLLAHHISRLIEQLVTIPPMRTSKPIPDLPQPAGNGLAAALPEGSYIWNRSGRLLFNRPLHEWIFVFQTDSPRLTAPPLILLPCHLLERMENRSAHDGTEIKFRISGRITQFKGRNYLLITYFEVVHNLGRF